MQIFLTNTLTRRKEIFVPADPGRVTMYVCGPTVYNHAHIGNARPPVVFDVLFRLLRRAYGEDAILYARNFTDIDDKIIAKMAETGESLEAITSKYAAIYEADMGALGVLAPTLAPRATAHVPAMIALIERLIEKESLIENKIAYKNQHGVWFSVARAIVHQRLEYGKLSGRTIEDLGDFNPDAEFDKESLIDFALWKAAKPGEPFWESPFGKGRPGWHIECSAMIEEVLGGTIDIHGGGMDLIFPHHENEIAQSETAHDHPLARVWLHNGFLTMDREKMSKSIGNIVTPRELLEQGWQGETIRWALLSAHYRAPLDWSDELLMQSQASLDRIYGALMRLDHVQAAKVDAPEAFVAALSDDLNTPKAFAELAALTTAANVATKPAAQAEAKGQLLAAGALLGLLNENPGNWFRASFGDKAADIDALVAQRVEARAAKDFTTSDRIRDELAAMGVEVMDGPQGSTWRRKG